MRETRFHARSIALLMSVGLLATLLPGMVVAGQAPTTTAPAIANAPGDYVITLEASDPVPVGDDIRLRVTVTGFVTPASGTMYFYLWGPGEPSCADNILFDSMAPVTGDGIYISEPYTTTEAGTYRWSMSYDPEDGGLGPNSPTWTECNDPGSTVEVGGEPGPSQEPSDDPEPSDEPPTEPAPESESSDTASTSTDQENDGATPADPIETAVDWSSGTSTGTTTIAESPAITQTPPSGYTIVGQQVDITAPAGTAAAPLSIRFLLDPAIVPPGEDETTIVVLRNGVPVPDCDPVTSGVADPDPCVYARIRAGDDLAIRVYTSAASHWNFATAPAFDYTFSGFVGLGMPPVSNTAVAGKKVDLTFSLGGNQGTDIFAPGSPTSYRADCATWAPLGPEKPARETRKGLTYKASKDRYTYPWNTNAVWDGTCRVLAMSFKDGSQASARFRLPYHFSGFAGIKPPPLVNTAKAGRALDLTFSLDGFEGVQVLAAGSPTSRAAGCSNWTPTGAASPTASAGFSYKAARDEYTYRWNVPAGFVNSCRILTVRFDDGTEVTARFRFTR